MAEDKMKTENEQIERFLQEKAARDEAAEAAARARREQQHTAVVERAGELARQQQQQREREEILLELQQGRQLEQDSLQVRHTEQLGCVLNSSDYRTSWSWNRRCGGGWSSRRRLPWRCSTASSESSATGRRRSSTGL